ncbi:hypothetical protein ASE74_05925 [Pedobacter sp. Leaf216]|uniref:hypothetical protein n=1 Tax=Pedobacter sp. Leaf216 TaxID=1735684 RepID=UPI0006FBFC6A|nr:hypothetical protein [Pedobacter sp. Leaf216]KQM69523.1 hypothetical protein ASE74_05925 [Pedobacter sp. Leaf216]
MENFNIITDDGEYTIEPQENGTYRILQEENKIGTVYAEPGDQGVVQWRTMDELDDQLVLTIGEQITEHNNSI